MVAGPAAADAVRRARKMPSLRVGLHLVLIEGRPVLPAERIPDLVDGDGVFRADMARLGLDIALRASLRQQLSKEITAQFEAYRATGLTLDHVNAHKHFHIHPVIAEQIMTIGPAYAMRALRIPREPAKVLARVEKGRGTISSMIMAPIMAPWSARLEAQARRARLITADAVFGLRWTGAMTLPRVAGLLKHLPSGLIEIYTHPATSNDFAGHARGYRYADELDALCDQASIAALCNSGYRLGGFGDFVSN